MDQPVSSLFRERRDDARASGNLDSGSSAHYSSSSVDGWLSALEPSSLLLRQVQVTRVSAS